jgi:hypothetical protein
VSGGIEHVRQSPPFAKWPVQILPNRKFRGNEKNSLLDFYDRKQRKPTCCAA